MFVKPHLSICDPYRSERLAQGVGAPAGPPPSVDLPAQAALWGGTCRIIAPPQRSSCAYRPPGPIAQEDPPHTAAQGPATQEDQSASRAADGTGTGSLVSS